MRIPRSALAVAKCCDKENNRFALGAVLLHRESKNQAFAVATDGRMLAALGWHDDDRGDKIDDALVPAAAFEAAAKCKIGTGKRAKEEHRTIWATQSDGKALLVADDGEQQATWSPSLAEGRFPACWRDYAHGKPKNEMRVCVNATMLCRLLEVIAVHAGNSVDLVFEEGNAEAVIHVQAHDVNGHVALGAIMPMAPKEPAPAPPTDADEPEEPTDIDEPEACDTVIEPPAPAQQPSSPPLDLRAKIAAWKAKQGAAV